MVDIPANFKKYNRKMFMWGFRKHETHLYMYMIEQGKKHRNRIGRNI